MKRNNLPLFALTLTLLLTACGAGSASPADNATEAAAPSAGVSQDAAAGEDGSALWMPSSTEIEMAQSDVYTDPDAKIIRTAELIIQTTDFGQSVSALAQLTEEQGGYYETAQIQEGDYQQQNAARTAYYVVRIPRENFTAFRDSMGEVGHLYSITEDSQDVGETYYDTEARLATLTTKRERLLSLLEQAEIMEDIITLENALADVQYEIDMHTAELRKYDSLINYATFRINLEEVVKITQEPGPEDSFGVKLSASLKEGAAGFGDGLQALVLWIARNLIALVIVAALAVLGVWIGRRQYRKFRNTPGDSGK